VRYLCDRKRCTLRRACRLVGISRSYAGYKQRTRPDEEALRDRIRELAGEHGRYGYRRITSLLHREGEEINAKHVHRVWKAEGLSLPQRRPRRRQYGPKGEIVRKAEHPNHVWSYDILEDRTERGSRLRILTVLDEYTRESLAIGVGRSVSAQTVVEELKGLFFSRGIPEHIRSDNGPEFVAKAVQNWLEESECKTIYIEPGSPWENPYIESFNGKLRDECLNREIFRNTLEAQVIIEAWRKEYNRYRPHSSLGYMTPEEFAGQRANPPSPGAVIDTLQVLTL
jgi:transposase InsO family protein